MLPQVVVSQQELEFIGQITGNADITPASDLCQPLASLVETIIARVGSESQYTARSYRSTICIFLRYLDLVVGDRIPPEIALIWRPFVKRAKDHRTWLIQPPAAVLNLVDQNTIENFAVWQAEEGRKETTIQTYIHEIRALLRIAHSEGVLAQNHAIELEILLRKLPAPQGSRFSSPPDYEPGRILSRVEVRWLRSNIDLGSNKGKRDLAILDCILYLALYPDEIISLQRCSFCQEDDAWWLLVPPIRRSRPRRMKVRAELLASLHLWLQTATLYHQDDNLPLFVNIKGDRIGKRSICSRTVERVVEDYGTRSRLAALEVSGRLTPTILRRTCARTAYDHGATSTQIQALLGYSSLESVARFIGLDGNNEVEAVDLVWY